MIAALKTIRTLIGYILCGLLFALPFVVLAVCALAGSKWAFNSLHSLDITICSICHGTRLETISARSYRLRHQRRYALQMLVIDMLARPLDGLNHCKRAFEWESKTILLVRA